MLTETNRHVLVDLTWEEANELVEAMTSLTKEFIELNMKEPPSLEMFRDLMAEIESNLF